MKYCAQCGKEMIDEALFCPDCGAAVTNPAPEAPAPAEVMISDADAQEEQEFLDMTHRILRWERKAWSISGKACLIIGIVFAALFMLLSLAFFAIGDEMAIAGVAYIFMGLAYGAMFIGLGVISKIAADKTVQYLDRMYTDFRPTLDRCGSVGMLVFSALLGNVSPIFFIINFVRIKSGRRVIERILANQSEV